MRPKCGQKSGFWDNFLKLKENAKNMKKILGAV